MSFITKLRHVLCALFDHPRVVDTCLGQVTCTRCDAILGDTLAGCYDLSDYVLNKHDCEACDEMWAGLRWHERLLTLRRTS